ncbi:MULTISPECIES: erythromycin esterase family protein [unclassified Clostridium]|uniref:erythromycin esterase family protein n=1 Tax=unclassified Clostridium TaxID=2614128 RepID=UPI0032162CD4
MKMKLRLISIVLLSILCLTACSKVNENPEVKALKKSVIPISTVEAGNGFKDLMPIKEILKDKKIVGMGEATHGTSEFFKMKHRFFEFLVEEMGYRVFAMECDGGAGQVINDYILKGEGNIEDSLPALYRTEEIKNMIKWMKEYNDEPSNEKKIKFYGMDIFNIVDTLPKLSYYLEKLDKELQTKVEDTLNTIYRNDIKALTNEQLDSVLLNINEIKKDMENTKEKYLNNNLQNEYELAIWNLNLVSQSIEYRIEVNKSVNHKVQSVAAINLRDKYMAANVKWIQDHESKLGNDKVMLWAHNIHVSSMDNMYRYMGKNLKEMYGDEYYSIGFEFSKGSFNVYNAVSTWSLTRLDIDANASEYLAYKFDKTQIPISFLDFNSASQSEKIAEMLSRNQTFNFGTSYYDEGTQKSFQYIPKNLYDGLIYIKETTPSKIRI